MGPSDKDTRALGHSLALAWFPVHLGVTGGPRSHRGVLSLSLLLPHRASSP